MIAIHDLVFIFQKNNCINVGGINWQEWHLTMEGGRERQIYIVTAKYDSIIKLRDKSCRNNSRSKRNHIHELARCLLVNSTLHTNMSVNE